MTRIALAVVGALAVSSAVTAFRAAEPGNVEASVGQTEAEAPWGLPDDALLGFIEIPAGEFLMGSDRSRDPQAEDDELPEHRVTLPAFFIGRHEVTVAQFGAFVEDSGYRVDSASLERPPDSPIRNLSWYAAVAYCAWLTEQLRRWEGTPEPLANSLGGAGTDRRGSVTLPSEAEWEKAARGTDGQVYPLGGMRATLGDFSVTAVGNFPSGASPYGVLEMIGNIFEWTRSLHALTFEYPYAPNDGREDMSAPVFVRRVVRGGAFYPGGIIVSAAFRNWFYPDNSDRLLGFRLVVSSFSP